MTKQELLDLIPRRKNPQTGILEPHGRCKRMEKLLLYYKLSDADLRMIEREIKANLSLKAFTEETTLSWASSTAKLPAKEQSQ